MKPNYSKPLSDIIPALRKERDVKRQSRLLLKQAKCRHTDVRMVNNTFTCYNCNMVLDLTPEEQEKLVKKLLLKQRKECKHNPIFVKETKKNKLFECSLCGKSIKEKIDATS